MELKKLRPDWEVALEYYLVGNLLAALPLLIVGAALGILIQNVGIYFLFKLISGIIIMFFSFRLSSIYINKHFLIEKVRKISNLATTYIIVFNLAFLVFLLARMGTVTLDLFISALLVVAGAVILSVYTPKFIKPATQVELESIKSSASLNSRKVVGGSSGVLRSAFLVAAGIIFMVFAPFILYFVIVGENAQWFWLAWFAVVCWEIIWIYLFWRFVFRKRTVA